MTDVVSIDHPTDRPNFTHVRVGAVDFWFSYRTIIAFQTTGPRVVRKNSWGPTTGKHLNELSFANDRVSSDEFERQLTEVMNAIGDALQVIA